MVAKSHRVSTVDAVEDRLVRFLSKANRILRRESITANDRCRHFIEEATDEFGAISVELIARLEKGEFQIGNMKDLASNPDRPGKNAILQECGKWRRYSFVFMVEFSQEETEFNPVERRKAERKLSLTMESVGPLIGRILISAYWEQQIGGLSPRMKDTLRMLLKGAREQDAALILGVSVNTVHDYVKKLYRKLNVCSRGELSSLLHCDLAIMNEFV